MRSIGFVLALSGLLFAGYQIYEHSMDHPAGTERARPGYEARRDAPTGESSEEVGSPIQEIIAKATQFFTTATTVPGANPGGQSVALSSFRGAIHYAPAENLEAIDSALILHSRCDHLDVAAYSFTDYALAQAVKRFADSGRRVRVYRDYDQYAQEVNRSGGSWVANLLKGDPNISVRVKNSHVLMHIKAYSDGCLLREGSANWSPSGEKQQDNTLVVTTDAASVRAFEHEFEWMWNRPDNIIIQ